MDLTPYIEGLQRDLTASAAPGGPEVARAADLLTGSIEAAARLCLLEALSDAAAEITTKLGTATVDVRLKGREADLTVTEMSPPADEPLAAAPTTAAPADAGETARITLRLPEQLKEQAELAASAEGVSVNAWLVRAISAALLARTTSPRPAATSHNGRRLSGYAQA